MANKILSIILSLSLLLVTWPLESCTKSESVGAQARPSEQAPPSTYAVPTADQLYQLVAPIALFPDNLLAQVLAASTYPDQVTAANTWIQQNSNQKGGLLMQAVDQQPWDASVKGLTQFPDVLNQMASNLSWTSALGDAYFNIPQNVMNAVQVMRQRAQQAGNLKSNTQQNVSVENQAPAATPPPESSGAPQLTIVQPPPQTIVIQPAQPDVVYVPAYNPTVVYGTPVPVYPGYSGSDLALASVVSFGVGIAVGAAIRGGSGCCGWGWNSWGCGWHNSTVVYNRNTYISTSNTFINRNNYYNRNFNNVNVNNVNINNVNRNNVNRNNLSTNNLSRNNYNTANLNRGQLNNTNYRANNFNNGSSTPQFNQQRNQQQFRNANQAELGRQSAATQTNLSQQNRPGQQPQNRQANQTPLSANQNQRQAGRGSSEQASRSLGNLGSGNLSQNQRQPQRGYGEQASRASGNSAFGNYGQGGNTRVNSARGQQSLEGRGAGRSVGSSGERASARGTGGRRR